jgi:hypothetical protein
MTERAGLVSCDTAMFTLRDADFDHEGSITGALEDSRQHVYGSNGQILVVQTVDGSVRVHVTVVTLTAPPTQRRARLVTPTHPPVHLPLRAIDVHPPFSSPPPELTDVPLPSGPGPYIIAASHHGRDTLTARLTEEVYPNMTTMSGDDIYNAYRELDGIERHRLRIWPAGTEMPCSRGCLPARAGTESGTGPAGRCPAPTLRGAYTAGEWTGQQRCLPCSGRW